MKKAVLLLLPLLAAACQKTTDAVPDTDEVEFVTQGRNMDCGVAQVLVSDTARVRRILGGRAYGSAYLALKLDTALWVRGSHTVLARIRQPLPSEAIICHAMGPGYPHFMVTSARLKPGSK